MSQNKKILAFILMIVAIGLILVVDIWVYKGFLVIEGVEAPFQINFKSYARLECNKNPCRLRIDPQNYQVTISKEGYYDLEEKIEINWQEEKRWSPILQKLPTINQVENPTDIFQKKYQAPPAIGANNPYVFYGDYLYFMDLTSGQVYQDLNGERTLLAKLEDIAEARLFASEKSLFIVSAKQLFEVIIAEKRKFQLLPNEKISQIRVDNFGLIVQSERGFLMRLNNDEFVDLPFETNLNLICAINEKAILTSDNSFWLFDGQNLQKISKFDTTQEIEKIVCENDNSVLVLLDNEDVYRLEF